MEIAIDTGLQTYDIAALVPIITGAGGCVTSWSGVQSPDRPKR